jgi:hypothetical protein
MLRAVMSKKSCRKVTLMRILSTSMFLLLISSTILAGNAAAQSSYDLRSPDGRIEIRIRTAKQVLQVSYHGASIRLL